MQKAPLTRCCVSGLQPFVDALRGKIDEAGASSVDTGIAGVEFEMEAFSQITALPGTILICMPGGIRPLGWGVGLS